MKKYRIAAILMIIHGGLMELGGVLAMIPALLIGTDQYDIGKYFSFKLPYFQENLHMMMVVGAIYGILRLVGAIGLLKNRMWVYNGGYEMGDRPINRKSGGHKQSEI